MKTPFIHHVPTSMVENLKWRARIHQRVMEDPSYANVIWDACAIDPLFYICGFVYTYDPRTEPFTKIPFILYPFQRKAILEILSAINRHDLFIEKTRDMGASWLCVLAFEWQWHFAMTQKSFLMGSRVDEYVDDSENPKALFWKVDYCHDHLPPWLMPRGFNKQDHRRKKHIINPVTNSVIDGESTTKGFARGDRRTAILLDEFAAVDFGHKILPATLATTRSRIFNSTPLGTGNAYFDISLTSIRKLRFHWSDHPEKSKGLYTTDEGGSLKILDHENYPADYHPILDGKLRSVPYDEQEARSSPRQMAQEWDIDYGGSQYQYFSAPAIQDAIRQFTRPPVVIGDLEYDNVTAEPIRFREDEHGRLELWCLPTKDGNFSSDHKIVIGVDVSAGTGASNSCICGYDKITNEKILQYVNPYIRPEEFARQVVAIARWLGNAVIIWESNGPGSQFGSRVIELGYRNVYFYRREEAISKKVSDIPGWAPTKEGKLVVIGNYRAAIEKGICVNRSKEALEECLEYIFDPGGGVSHARSKNKEDPSGARSNHGDRVMADALAWMILSGAKAKPSQAEKPKVPIGSLAWRREMREKGKVRSSRELLHSDGWG